MFPYKTQLVQELKPVAHEQRRNYTIRIKELARKNNEFINQLIISDEAHFQLNSRFWGMANLRRIHERRVHPLQYTVWCGVTSQEIIRPCFCETENGNCVTITSARY